MFEMKQSSKCVRNKDDEGARLTGISLTATLASVTSDRRTIFIS